ncbi:mutarotase [Aliifodinibius salipaludis]|uniref:Mutarotase n=1 Tax=Fodinibius salipaludis TaxID=2032627 RepID=A0A2A2G6X8_9BACT|nr:2'-5' RNA ligase family protein [Aliifodinibius salipaludis]PAU92612.1 mutarotase [Aliifodinibius salipaludis]
MDLENHYNKLWSQSLQKFRSNEFKFDPLINSKDDKRYGVTLLARPSEEVKQNISDALEEIRSVAPHQYYYPESDLHITILSIISCYDGFSLDQIDPVDYEKVVQYAINSISPFEIEFRGLTASPSCILVQGFPSSNQLIDLRNELRELFKDASLQHSIDKRYQLQTAHMTAIRFKESFENTERFINKTTELRDRSFGSCVLDEVELVGNDWYQQKEKVESIAKFSLSKQKV